MIDFGCRSHHTGIVRRVRPIDVRRPCDLAGRVDDRS